MKNLKMFAIGLAAFAAMTMGVHALEVTCVGNTAQATDGSKCYDSITAALTGVEENGTVTLLTDNSFNGSSMQITKNVTINLNGKTVTFTNGQRLVLNSNAKLVLTGNGELKSTTVSSHPLISVAAGSNLTVEGSVKLTTDSKVAAAPAIMVDGNGSAKTTVTIGGNVVVNSDGYGLVIGSGTNTSASGVTVNLNGTWKTEGYTVKVNGKVAYTDTNAPVVNIKGGSYTSDGVALYASGYGIWNITGGTITGKDAIQVLSGKVTISGGKFVASSDATGTLGSANARSHGAALDIIGRVANYQPENTINVSVTGGEFISENAHAMYIKTANNAKIAIGGGKFTSAEDGEGNQLPALAIEDWDFVENEAHKGMITGGEFTGSIIGDVKNSGNSAIKATSVVEELTSGEIRTEGGKVVVGTPAEPEQQDPDVGDGDANTPGTTNPDVPNVPKTNDNILVYASLGLVSALTVGFTTKRKENN